MVKLLSRIVSALFYVGKSRVEKKILRIRFESRLYARAMRRRARKVGVGTICYGPVAVTPHCTIGDHTTWGKNVRIYGEGEVVVGNHSGMAEDTVVYTQNHDYDHDDNLPFGAKYVVKPVTIGDYVWIGMRCFILPGATIGEGAVIQAGSVVQGEIPPCAIAGGNPARVYGMRDVEHYNRLKVAAGGQPVVIRTKSASGAVPAPAGASAPGDARAKYVAAFVETFAVTPAEAEGLSYGSVPAWDSAGQMTLVGRLEADFGVTFAPDDIYGLRSFAGGMAVLKEKYGFVF